MGSYGWAELSIGGKARYAALVDAFKDTQWADRLDEALAGRGEHSEIGEGLFLSDDGYLVLASNEAYYTKFTDLEDALQLNGIAFDRQSDPVEDYGEMVAHFRPGMFIERPAEEGADLIRLDQVRDALSQGIRHARAWLKKHHPHVPALEKLEVIYPTVRCRLCQKPTEQRSAHRHQRRWIGACCWDERLATTA